MDQQTFPDIFIPYETTINAPIEPVWNCVSDFGGWDKWTSAYTDMKIEGDGVDKAGAKRTFQSAQTKTVYEEEELEKDNVNHVLKFSLLSATPAVPFISHQVVSATLESVGENQTKVHYLVTITPSSLIPDDMIKKVTAILTATYDKMFGDLADHLKTSK